MVTLLVAAVVGIVSTNRRIPLINRNTYARTMMVIVLSFFCGSILGPFMFAMGMMLIRGTFAPGVAIGFTFGDPMLPVFTGIASGIAWWQLR